MPAISLNSKDGGRFKALLGGKPQLVDGQRLTFPVRDEIKAFVETLPDGLSG